MTTYRDLERARVDVVFEERRLEDAYIARASANRLVKTCFGSLERAEERVARLERELTEPTS